MGLRQDIFESLYQSWGELPGWLRKSLNFSDQIRALREFLGMTQAQLAKRAKQNSRLIRRLESGEVDPRLSSLQKTAAGLECELLIRFIPKQPVSKILHHHARQQAKAIVEQSQGTAALEEQ